MINHPYREGLAKFVLEYSMIQPRGAISDVEIGKMEETFFKEGCWSILE